MYNVVKSKNDKKMLSGIISSEGRRYLYGGIARLASGKVTGPP